MATTLPPLMSAEDVERITTMSRRTINRACDAGSFPEPVKLPSTGKVKPRIAWRGVDIQAWLDSLKTAEAKRGQ